MNAFLWIEPFKGENILAFGCQGRLKKNIFQVQYHIPLVIEVQGAQKSRGVWYCGVDVHHPLLNLSQILHWPVVIGP